MQKVLGGEARASPGDLALLHAAVFWRGHRSRKSLGQQGSGDYGLRLSLPFDPPYLPFGLEEGAPCH